MNQGPHLPPSTSLHLSSKRRNSIKDTMPPSFLGLPQELQDEIYRYLPVSSERVEGCIDMFSRSHQIVYGASHEVDNRILDTAIFLVNKQIYAEARNNFIKENNFQTPPYSDREVVLDEALQHATRIWNFFLSNQTNRVFTFAQTMASRKNARVLKLTVDVRHLQDLRALVGSLSLL